METRTQDAPSRPPTATRSSAVPGLLLFALLVLFACVSLRQVRPPDTVGPDAPATEFSSARAMTHLRAIAQQPRPLGSAEHARARDYIVSALSAQGLRTEVQKAEVVLARGGYPVRAATVENIVGRMAGTSASGGRSPLLMAHYDSAAGAPGAADDGSGVAAVLETVRALKAGGPPQQDILVLLTDGEELGLLGARAFLDEHPWAKDVGLVLNFEARGNRGPVMMFETGGAGDSELIKEFARVAPYPFATSLSDEVYRRLPNDTDFSLFKRAGYAGLNFAFIEGLTHYHTALDSAENIDERSIQHHGSYALALARHFGNGGPPPPSGRSVYFNALGSTMVRYPQVLVIPLAVVTTLLLVGVYVLGLKRRVLTIKGTVFGFIAMLLTTALAGALGAALWWGVRSLHSGWLPGGISYQTHYYITAFALLVVALAAALHILLRRWTSVTNLAAGALLWWLLLMWATSLLMPGASYLFTWPLFFSLCGLAYVFVERGLNPSSPVQFVVLLLCAVPAIFLLAPTLYLLYVAFSMGLVWAILVLLALTLGLLVPQLGVVTASKRWLVPGVTAVVGLGLIATASLTTGFDRERPKFNSVSYALSGDTGRALWVSPDRAPDAWTSQFFTKQTEVGPLEQFVSARFPYMKAPAPAAPLTAPGVAVVQDATNGDIRATRLRITSARRAQSLTVYLGAEVEVVRAWVGGREVDTKALPPPGPRGSWSVQYWGLPAEGFELSLETRAGRPLSLTVVDSTDGLPQLDGFTYQPRPEGTIQSPYPYSDATLVNKSFTF